jgi:hypothetical protein
VRLLRERQDAANHQARWIDLATGELSTQACRISGEPIVVPIDPDTMIGGDSGICEVGNGGERLADLDDDGQPITKLTERLREMLGRAIAALGSHAAPTDANLIGEALALLSLAESLREED